LILKLAHKSRDAFISNMGLLVDKWPISAGCDAGGEVIKVGKNAISPLGEPFKVGDKVFGCTRLSFPGHSPYLENVRLRI
jgi:NADPH:quinone reductase-like Zn-dependent oxidoreductase